jgi:TRAP-type C4-dicarboxylate transport system permease small subunit
VFLYFSISQRREAHLTVTLIPELFNVFGGRWRLAAEAVKLVALVFSFAFMVAVVWWGLPEVEDSIKYEARTESLAFPMWPFLAVLLFSFASMAITMLFQIYREVQALRGRTVLVEERQEADGTH